VISSTGFPTVGWKTKNRAREAFFLSMGIKPEYISVMKLGSTSGKLSTKYAAPKGSVSAANHHKEPTLRGIAVEAIVTGIVTSILKLVGR